MKAKAKHESPLKIPMKFDDAMGLAVTVKPPKEGWAEYDKKVRASKSKRKVKRKPAA